MRAIAVTRLPKRVIAFILGILALFGIVASIAAWAAFSGDAGSQRGLVLRNATVSQVVVTLADGQSARIDPDDESIFVVRREHFPSMIRVDTAAGEPLLDDSVTYDFLVRAEFRVSFDENGFYPTTVLRSTPVRTPAS